MSDAELRPPFIYEGLYPAEDRKSAVGAFADVARSAAKQAIEVLEAARKPGMPLSVLSNIAREAPLGSVLVAFLLGVAVARRR